MHRKAVPESKEINCQQVIFLAQGIFLESKKADRKFLFREEVGFPDCAYIFKYCLHINKLNCLK